MHPVLDDAATMSGSDISLLGVGILLVSRLRQNPIQILFSEPVWLTKNPLSHVWGPSAPGGYMRGLMRARMGRPQCFPGRYGGVCQCSRRSGRATRPCCKPWKGPIGGFWVGASRSGEIAGLALNLLGADEKSACLHGTVRETSRRRRQGIKQRTLEIPGSLLP